MATTSPTTSPTLTLESLREKVRQAADVLLAVPDFAKGKTPESAVQFIWDKVLAPLGIYQDYESHALLMSDDCSAEDIRSKLLVASEAVIPVVRQNRFVSIIKPKVVTPEKPMVVTIDPSDKPVGQWTDLKLVEELNPGHDQSDEAATVLDNKVQGRAFVVYDDEEAGVVNIPTTMKMLGAAKRGRTPIHYSVGDCLKKLYRAIERPNVVFHQCPLHPDTLLMEGYCDTCGQTWDGKMETEALQFVRLVLEAGEAPERAPDVRALIVLAKAGVEALKAEYPKVAVTFKERKKDGTLPNLRQRSSAGRGVSDPMNPGKRF